MPGKQSEYSLVAQNVSVTFSTLRLTRDSHSKNFFERYGLLPSRTRKEAVKGVSLACKKGQSIGLVGRNGSGKSTLLRALAGLEATDSGEVWASSKPVFLGVSSALLPDRTGIENVRIGCLARGMSPDETDSCIPEIVSFADLGSAINDPINTYSSGMNARLRFAISALTPQSEILMVDEALGTGDMAFQEKSEAAIKRILDESGTIFLVSHAPRLVEQVCERAIWLFEGEIVADGPSDEVTEAYRWWSWNINKKQFAEAAQLLENARSTYSPPSF